MPHTGSASGRGRGRHRTQSRGDLKAAAILECAWEPLAVKGPTEITVDDLTTGAGVSHPAFPFSSPVDR